MDQVLRKTRYRFMATILAVVLTVVLLSWGMLQLYSSSELAKPAHISEVHKSAENNQAFATYLEEQKAYEAHFLTLASEIKQQEAQRITGALALTSALVITIGTLIAFLVARKLIHPIKEAYESQERFMQDAAHELRNPLAAMTAALQQTTPEQRKNPLLKTFMRQTRRLVHINEDLLFLERRANKNVEKISLSELLEDVIEELQPLAHKRAIKLDLTTENHIQKTMSASDYVRMVKNIIDNAIKYSPDSSTVSVSQKLIKNEIVISVTDNGIGIPLKDLPTIGDRFYRASNTGTIDGTGLGLAIVQKILNLYGGKKTIESRERKGTSVTLTLPA